MLWLTLTFEFIVWYWPLNFECDISLWIFNFHTFEDFDWKLSYVVGFYYSYYFKMAISYYLQSKLYKTPIKMAISSYYYPNNKFQMAISNYYNPNNIFNMAISNYPIQKTIFHMAISSYPIQTPFQNVHFHFKLTISTNRPFPFQTDHY